MVFIEADRLFLVQSTPMNGAEPVLASIFATRIWRMETILPDSDHPVAKSPQFIPGNVITPGLNGGGSSQGISLWGPHPQNGIQVPLRVPQKKFPGWGGQKMYAADGYGGCARTAE